MTKKEKVDLIINYYNEHFKFQKLVLGQEIDKAKIEAMSEQELDRFIAENCK